jgi:hypothetical protein
MKIRLAVITLSMSAHLAVAGTFPQNYTKILLPIVIQTPTPGALGSEWVTHVAITNTGAQPVSVIPYDFPTDCQILCPGTPTPEVPANTTFYPSISPPSDAIAGIFLYVARGREADVHVALRVQDISREEETWGTELPMVPESSFLTTVGVLEDIPLSPGFRSNLRVYDLNPGDGHFARIKLYAVDPSVQVPSTAPPDRLLLDRTIPFSLIDNDRQYRPGMIYVDLSNLPEFPGVQRVRAEITPGDSNPLQFWALASVTNNTTQHVTTISPR